MTTGPAADESFSPYPPSARTSRNLPSNASVTTRELPAAPSIFSSVVYALSPQYHAQATPGSLVTSPEAAVAVAVTASPTRSFPVLSILTDVTLTDPAAAILLVARVVYVLPPTFAASSHLTYLPW